MDVKCAFLNVELEDTIYVKQPLGFVKEIYIQIIVMFLIKLFMV